MPTSRPPFAEPGDLAPPSLLARTYARWRQPLERLLRRHLGQRADAEDAAQEVFARYCAAGKALPEDEQGPYLRTAARHLAHDAWQKSPQRYGFERVAEDELARLPADAASDPVQAAERGERLRRLEQALAELPERRREAFVLHSIDGLSQTEVAERMGISRRMVYNHVQLALAYCQLRVRYSSAEDMRLMQALHAEGLDDAAAGERP